MNNEKIPRHLGRFNEVEWLPKDDGYECYLYGLGEQYITCDKVKISTVDEDSEYALFVGEMKNLYIIEDNEEKVLTDTYEDSIEEKTFETETVRVAITSNGEEEYIRVRDKWYGPHYSAGELFMWWRHSEEEGENCISDEYIGNSPPDTTDVKEVILYEPFGSGGAFWAKCDDTFGGGDMPEEALSNVI